MNYGPQVRIVDSTRVTMYLSLEYVDTTIHVAFVRRMGICWTFPHKFRVAQCRHARLRFLHRSFMGTYWNGCDPAEGNWAGSRI